MYHSVSLVIELVDSQLLLLFYIKKTIVQIKKFKRQTLNFLTVKVYNSILTSRVFILLGHSCIIYNKVS